LGEACVRRFSANGAKVAIIDFNADAGRRLAAELGETAACYPTDVTDTEAVRRGIDQICKHFDGLHIVVNCAGVGTPMKVLGKNGPMPMEHFEQVVRINLIGTMQVLTYAAEQIVRNEPNGDGEKGVMINTASIAAFEGQIGQAAYAASKAAVVGLTLPVAREFSEYGIRVITIAPGLFETPMLASLPEKARASLTQMIPFPKRLGRPSEFAALAQHIVENPVLNGETIRLDSAIRMAAR
jgi:NAD(P)-dependent dehydrogenase (short-subunit alcohol dehydrogenase family)